MSEKDAPKKDGPPPERAVTPRKVLRSEELLGDAIEITLLHAGEEYRLRLTRNGKLILTK